MSDAEQATLITNAIVFIIRSMIYLGAIVVVVILVARRATLGRLLVLFGIAVPAILSFCGPLQPILFGIAFAYLNIGMEEFMALTTIVSASTTMIYVLVFTVLLIGIWMLAHEGRGDEGEITS